ncbi:MAG: carboxylesterase family protein [Deltaproteobacteria bacterium]|nr:carboxylesterase family protein [Deltaproteobacteria bacterium]
MNKKISRFIPRGLGPIAVLILAPLPLTGCQESESLGGSDAGRDEDGSKSESGQFIGAVSGLEFSTASISDTTDEDGGFTYRSNETITFSVGGLKLGSATGKSIITPLDIVPQATDAFDQRVNNILVFLQTLDKDGDLNNGIEITSDISKIVADYKDKIDFDQTTTAFASDAHVADLLLRLNRASVFNDTDPRDRTLRSENAAREYFDRSTSERNVVDTQYGKVSGYEANDSTWQWLGIPYATPPLGDMRWKPPQEPKVWTKTRDAVAWTDQAAQTIANEAFGEGGMSEDCLYLHVTAPKNASNFPVMVWFHGGAFAVLTSNTKQYNNPEGLTTKGVVLVTVSHRLGPFGYIAHPWLTGESGYSGSGNYGQMDLVMALKWVKNNIANFGGDPDNVTIFGQSGGGGKVFCLMMSPQAAGLFHKAICQSGATALVETSTKASSLAGMEAIGTAMFDRLGVKDLAEARALPWTSIIQSETDAGVTREVYRPNVDNYYLPDTYFQLNMDGVPSDVPFMVGVTSGDNLPLREQLPTFMTQRIPYYKSNQYVYIFDRVPDGWAALGLTSLHAFELPYLFKYPQGFVANYILGLVLSSDGTKPVIDDLDGDGITGTDGDSDDVWTSVGWNSLDDEIMETVMTLWTDFAKTGNPSTTSFTWPLYEIDNEEYVRIGPESTTVNSGLSAALP